MKKLFPIVAAGMLFAACGQNTNKQPAVKDQNVSFDNYKERFVEALWKQYPAWASSQGYHKYDSVLTVPDAASRAAETAFAKEQLDSLKAYDPASLNDNNRTDYLMMQNQLNSAIWAVNEQKAWEWDPSGYNVSGGIAEMLNGSYDTLDTRLHNIYLRMARIPEYYEAAKLNIKNPTKEHTQLAIEQNLGGISVFEKDLPDALAKSHLPDAEKQLIGDRAKQVVSAIKSYAEWLKQLKNDNPRSFRLGKELYAKKFEFDIQSGYTVDQVYDKAIAHKKSCMRKWRSWQISFGRSTWAMLQNPPISCS